MIKQHKLITTITSGLISLTLSCPAYGQIMWIYNPAANIVNNNIFTQMLITEQQEEELLERNQQQQLQKPESIDQTFPSRYSKSKLSFIPSIAERNKNLSEFVDYVKPINPSGARELLAFFNSIDIIAKVDIAMSKYGMRANNLSDIYALFTVLTWQASQGITTDPSGVTLKAVEGQFYKVLLSTPEIIKSTNSQKQKIGEIMLIQAALLSEATEQGATAHNPSEMAQLRAAALQLAQSRGIDFNVITVTTNGLGLLKLR